MRQLPVAGMFYISRDRLLCKRAKCFWRLAGLVRKVKSKMPRVLKSTKRVVQATAFFRLSLTVIRPTTLYKRQKVKINSVLLEKRLPGS